MKDPTQRLVHTSICLWAELPSTLPVPTTRPVLTGPSLWGWLATSTLISSLQAGEWRVDMEVLTCPEPATVMSRLQSLQAQQVFTPDYLLGTSRDSRGPCWTPPAAASGPLFQWADHMALILWQACPPLTLTNGTPFPRQSSGEELNDSRSFYLPPCTTINENQVTPTHSPSLSLTHLPQAPCTCMLSAGSTCQPFSVLYHWILLSRFEVMEVVRAPKG